MTRTKIEKQCDHCSKPFQADIREIKRGNAKYCSRSCGIKHSRFLKSISQAHNSICAHCNISFYRSESKTKSKSGLLFCSKLCKDIAQRLDGIRAIHPNHYGNKIKKRHCLSCDTYFITNRNKIFCDNYCRKKHEYDQYIIRWLNGLETGRSGLSGISNHIRRWLFEKYDSKCQEDGCGWSKINPTTGKVPLTIDHVNGDWRDNRPENLKLLCPCCHSLTPTYGSLNTGRGRLGRNHSSS